MILALTSRSTTAGALYDAASTILDAEAFADSRASARSSSAAARCPAVRVEVNPTQLNSYGLGLKDVATVLEPAERQPGQGPVLR